MCFKQIIYLHCSLDLNSGSIDLIIHTQEQWSSTFLMLSLFITVPHVVTPHHKTISFLLHNCKFATIMNHNNVDIWHVISKGVETHRLGTIALDGYHETRMRWLMRHHSSTCDVYLFIHGYTEVFKSGLPLFTQSLNKGRRRTLIDSVMWAV